VLGNARGDDGLTIGDLPELKVREDHVEFIRMPAIIVVRVSLSKAGHKYLTFLPAEGCSYLMAYLNKRLAAGEKVMAKTPIIASKADNTFVTTRNISKIIRKTMRPRFGWRPYVLRAYFATQMLIAESHGRVSHPYRMFFMGHKGDIEARYTTNKGRLPENLIEDMRMAFQNSAEYLEGDESHPVGDQETDRLVQASEGEGGRPQRQQPLREQDSRGAGAESIARRGVAVRRPNQQRQVHTQEDLIG